MAEEGKRQDEPETDHFTSSVIVRVAIASPPKVVTTTITPLNLGTTAPELTAIVGWEGIETLSSSVRVEAGAEPWSRLLTLLWAVLGPDTTPEPDVFRAGNWSGMVLTAQELDGPLHHSVLVVVDRDHGNARLIRSDPTREELEISIPTEVRELDAGLALVEMTSRLLAGRSCS